MLKRSLLTVTVVSSVTSQRVIRAAQAQTDSRSWVITAWTSCPLCMRWPESLPSVIVGSRRFLDQRGRIDFLLFPALPAGRLKCPAAVSRQNPFGIFTNGKTRFLIG